MKLEFNCNFALQFKGSCMLAQRIDHKFQSAVTHKLNNYKRRLKDLIKYWFSWAEMLNIRIYITCECHDM